MFNSIGRWVLTSALLLLTLSSFARACPSCKNSVVEIIPTKNGPMLKTDFDAANARSGFNSSIYLMLAGFGVVAGSLGFFVVKGAQTVTRDEQE